MVLRRRASHARAPLLNIFENNKGITKILIYSSATEINQINVFLFVILIGAICESDQVISSMEVPWNSIDFMEVFHTGCLRSPVVLNYRLIKQRNELLGHTVEMWLWWWWLWREKNRNKVAVVEENNRILWPENLYKSATFHRSLS